VLTLGASAAGAQAPAAGPIALFLPASTRAVAEGNAWVAGRDEFVVFYNSAQITSASGASLRLARYGPATGVATLAAGQAVGPLNIGWGTQLVDTHLPVAAPYPFTVDGLVRDGTRATLSVAAVVAGNYSYRGFRVGAGATYATDRVTDTSSLVGAAPGTGGLLGDIGLSRSLLGGTAALAWRNLSLAHERTPPRQASLGWARSLPAGPFDLAVIGGVTRRGRWTGGGGGGELSLSWIEGWSVAARAGARRAEATNQRGLSAGFALTGDRLGVEYAADLLRDGRAIHDLTLRWR
jgi:hypothetical protein